jgi:uncharacterized protein YjbI with pentapeptide repeats
MPVSLLKERDLTRDPFEGQNWSGADLSAQDLHDATFVDCAFSGVIFDGADLTNTTFENCQFARANPEAAASLEGTCLQVAGLSEEQLATCAARGATIEPVEEEEEEQW